MFLIKLQQLHFELHYDNGYSRSTVVLWRTKSEEQKFAFCYPVPFPKKGWKEVENLFPLLRTWSIDYQKSSLRNIWSISVKMRSDDGYNTVCTFQYIQSFEKPLKIYHDLRKLFGLKSGYHHDCLPKAHFTKVNPLKTWMCYVRQCQAYLKCKVKQRGLEGVG